MQKTHQDVIRVMDVAGQLGFVNVNISTKSAFPRLLVKHDFKVYLRLLSYLKPYWGVAILVFIGFAINAATEVLR